MISDSVEWLASVYDRFGYGETARGKCTKCDASIMLGIGMPGLCYRCRQEHAKASYQRRYAQKTGKDLDRPQRACACGAALPDDLRISHCATCRPKVRSHTSRRRGARSSA